LFILLLLQFHSNSNGAFLLLFLISSLHFGPHFVAPPRFGIPSAEDGRRCLFALTQKFGKLKPN
jgi:hypothetical protein